MKTDFSRRIARELRRVGQHEPKILLSVLVVVAMVWGFIEIADEVIEGETRAFDKWVVRSLRQPGDDASPIGPGWAQELGRDATALGGSGALTLFTAIVAGYLWLDHKRRLAVFVVAATVSGLLVSLTLKQIIGRPRPDILPQLSHVYTSSFPSGHSMLAAVVYLTLGALLAASIPRKRLKVYVIAVAMVLAVIVGLSRIYLGVHYPTDVLAGWMAGVAWALVCWVAVRWLQLRRRVESAGASTGGR